MEKIDQDEKWLIYKNTSVSLSKCLAQIAHKLLGCSSGTAIKCYKHGLLGDISREEFEKIISNIGEEFIKHEIFQKESGFSDADFATGFQDLIGFEGEEFDNFVNMFKRSLAERPKIQCVLEEIPGAVVTFNSDWITYISDKPIRGKLQINSSPIPCGKFKLLAQDFGSIIMSVQTAQYSDGPVFQNSMIFKNPYHLIKGEGYNNLSIMLHSFAGKIAQEFWSNKVYMTVAPVPKMQEIILASFKAGELFIGDEQKKPYSDFPPVLHKFALDISIHIIKIAKEGVDTSEYPDSELPDELTAFSEIVDYRILSSTLMPDVMTFGGAKNYIKVEALAQKFLGYCGKDMP